MLSTSSAAEFTSDCQGSKAPASAAAAALLLLLLLVTAAAAAVRVASLLAAQGVLCNLSCKHFEAAYHLYTTGVVTFASSFDFGSETITSPSVRVSV
jgi:hypothetical protein